MAKTVLSRILGVAIATPAEKLTYFIVNEAEYPDLTIVND